MVTKDLFAVTNLLSDSGVSFVLECITGESGWLSHGTMNQPAPPQLISKPRRVSHISQVGPLHLPECLTLITCTRHPTKMTTFFFWGGGGGVGVTG